MQLLQLCDVQEAQPEDPLEVTARPPLEKPKTDGTRLTSELSHCGHSGCAEVLKTSFSNLMSQLGQTYS